MLYYSLKLNALLQWILLNTVIEMYINFISVLILCQTIELKFEFIL